MADLFDARSDVDVRSDPGSTLVVPRVPGLDLVRRLGAGAHAEVWLATEPGSGERVAVKIPLDGAEARLGREAELLQRIDHPHVIRLRRVEPAARGVVLVLDHADGGSLAALVTGRGRLDPGETTTVVVPIARALAAMHALGLVHGDVSATNVLFTRDGRPVLADLGVAADLAGVATRAGGDLGGGELWGTPGWVDPAARRPGPGADVWALGALLRFCLTGSPATPGASAAAGSPVGAGPGGAGPVAQLLAIAEDCAATDPALRPTALTVSRAVWDACRPEPVRLLEVHARLAACEPVGAAELTRRIRQDAVDPDRPGSRRAGRRLGLPGLPGLPGLSRRVLGPVAVVAGAGLLGVVAALAVMPELAQVGRPDRPGAVARPASPVEVDPQARQVVQTLAAARARALASAAEPALAEVDQPGSAALAQDLTVVRELAGSGVRVRGLTFQVGAVRLVGAGGDRWTVEAEVTTSAYERVDLTGRVLAQVPAAPIRLVTLGLVRTGDGWRVTSASPSA